MAADYRQYPFLKHRLPLGWAATELREVLLEIQSGFSSGNNNQSGEGIPHLRPMNVSPLGEISMDDVRYIPPDAGISRLTAGDVLFTNTSSTVWVGKSAVVRENLDWAFSNHMTRLRVGTGMEPEFVARQLHYLCMCGYFAVHCKQHINQSSIGTNELADKVPFRCPPAAEQKRITSKLNQLLDRERKVRDSLQELPGLIREYRAAVLESACVGRLVHNEATLVHKQRRKFESAAALLGRALRDRRTQWETSELARMCDAGKEPTTEKWKERYKEPEPATATEGQSVPTGWTVASVGQCGFVQLGRQRSPENRSKNHPRPYIRAANITESGIDVTDILEMDFMPEEVSKFRLGVGDILLSEASGSPGQVGKPAIWRGEINECCFQNTVIRLKPVTILGAFLLIVFRYFYTSGAFARLSGGVGINHLGADNFSQMPVLLPPLDEQVRIVAEVQRRLSTIERIELEVRKAIEQTSQLRASFFHAAILGKLSQQRKSDEPAFKLLSRIPSERETMAAEAKRQKPQVKQPMKKLSAEVVREAILEIPKDRFTFSDLRTGVRAEYEPLKNILFDLLAEAKPCLRQVFDPAVKEMRFQRVKS